MNSIEKLLLLPVGKLRARLLRIAKVPTGLIEAIESDPREGARRLGGLLRARRAKAQAEHHRLNEMFRIERSLWKRGFRQVAGVDEAGVGPLAGPVVAAAVILPRRYRLHGLNDSKKIGDPSRRAELARRIRGDAVCWAVGRAEVAEIDMYNIYQASLLAMERAVAALAVRPDFVLADARTIPRCPVEQRGVVRGDALSASIAAASLLAKTTRDSLMEEFDRQYPGYGFAVHKGYPTPEHCRVLRERGAVPLHRRTFLPVRQVMGWVPVQRELFPPDPGSPPEQ